MSDFDEIESLFSQVLTASVHAFSETERSEVQSFIDVGEYGLALETLVDIYVEEKKVASPETVKLIERLATAMSMDPTSLLLRIPKAPIDPNQYPLFARMVSGLFPGIFRMTPSEDQLTLFLLSFFRESEIERLLAELKEISSKNLSDKEWEQYWYTSSPAFSVPSDAASSDRLLRMVMDAILERQKR